MLDRQQFDTILLVIGFLLPAIILLVFAWFGWFANKRPTIKLWRFQTFKWGLFIAVDTAVFVPAGVHLLLPGQQGNGLWRIAVRLGTILWILSLAASLVGKGSEKYFCFVGASCCFWVFL
jgi:hypothetical protein